MFSSFKSAATAGLAILALAATPALARDDYYRGHDRGGDDAAIAIGAGVVGLALGAALASGSRDRDYYYDNNYYDGGNYYPRGDYYRSYPRYYGSYDRGYPRNYRRGGNGWRGNRHDGWGRHGGRGERRWRY